MARLQVAGDLKRRHLPDPEAALKFAVKKLTRSDLTLFDAQLHRQNAGKQKSINLNRRTFVDALFPDAPAQAAGSSRRLPVELRIFGPDGIPTAHIVTRKIIAAGGNQKNWRLNGETIRNPDDGRHPGRYNELQEGDYALMGFDGVDVPTSIELVLVSGREGSPERRLHRATTRLLMKKGTDVTMAVLSPADLADLQSAAASISEDHPAAQLMDPRRSELLEEAALGSVEAIERLSQAAATRQSAADLAAARQRLADIGRDGELLVHGLLADQKARGAILSFTWDSEVNAVNPWDFSFLQVDETPRRVGVKATNGPHGRDLHVSQAEVRFAAADDAPRTEIWRVSELTDEGGVVRRSRNFRKVARRIREICNQFEPGLSPDGWTLNPDWLTWGDPIALRFDDEPDD